MIKENKTRRPVLLCIKGKAHRVHNCVDIVEALLNYSTKYKVLLSKNDIRLIYSDLNEPNKVDFSSIGDIIWETERHRMGGERVHKYLMYTDYKEMMSKTLRERDTIFVIGPDRKLYENFYHHNMAEVRGPGWQEFKNSLGPTIQFGFLYQNKNNLMIIGPMEDDGCGS